MSHIALIGPLKAWGGLERLFVTLANQYIAMGHTVEIVCVRGGETPYPDELASSVTITTLATRGKFSAVRRITRWINASRPDAVVTVKDHTAQVSVLARMFASLSPRLVVVVSNTLDYVARRRVQRALIRRLYPLADQIVALSQGVADDLVTTFSIRRSLIDVIYQPVIPDDLEKRLTVGVDHPWLDDERAEPVLIGCGRLAHQKNFHLLISTLAKVRARRPVRLIILGEGVQRESLQNHAQSLGVAEHVDLHGAVADPIPFMAASDVFVLSSRYEGFANVVAEALATGVPVVSSDCPSGPREILRNGELGWLVDPGDAGALAQAVETALDFGRSPVPDTAIDAYRPGTIAAQYLHSMGLGSGPIRAAESGPTKL